MLYIISGITKSLFIDTQVCPLTCAFLTPSKDKINNITAFCFGYKINEEERKRTTALIRKSFS